MASRPAKVGDRARPDNKAPQATAKAARAKARRKAAASPRKLQPARKGDVQYPEPVADPDCPELTDRFLLRIGPTVTGVKRRYYLEQLEIQRPEWVSTLAGQKWLAGAFCVSLGVLVADRHTVRAARAEQPDLDGLDPELLASLPLLRGEDRRVALLGLVAKYPDITNAQWAVVFDVTPAMISLDRQALGDRARQLLYDSDFVADVLGPYERIYNGSMEDADDLASTSKVKPTHRGVALSAHDKKVNVMFRAGVLPEATQRRAVTVSGDEEHPVALKWWDRVKQLQPHAEEPDGDKDG